MWLWMCLLVTCVLKVAVNFWMRNCIVSKFWSILSMIVDNLNSCVDKAILWFGVGICGEDLDGGFV